MAVREIGDHMVRVIFKGKEWQIEPHFPDLDRLATVQPVILNHVVDRHETKLKRLRTKIDALRPQLDEAKEKLQRAELDADCAEIDLKDAWLFKSNERREFSLAKGRRGVARRKYEKVLEVWNPLVNEFNELNDDPARYVTKATAKAWSYDWKLYQITHVHPSATEAKILIERFLAKKKREIVLAEDELRAPEPRKGTESPGAGVIYILKSQQVRGLKIGGTSRSADARAKELSTTGVPTPFDVLFDQPVDDWRAAEQRVHARLSRYRINDDREFFDVDPRVAIREILQVAGAAQRTEKPMARCVDPHAGKPTAVQCPCGSGKSFNECHGSLAVDDD